MIKLLQRISRALDERVAARIHAVVFVLTQRSEVVFEAGPQLRQGLRAGLGAAVVAAGQLDRPRGAAEQALDARQRARAPAADELDHLGDRAAHRGLERDRDALGDAHPDGGGAAGEGGHHAAPRDRQAGAQTRAPPQLAQRGGDARIGGRCELSQPEIEPGQAHLEGGALVGDQLALQAVEQALGAVSDVAAQARDGLAAAVGPLGGQGLLEALEGALAQRLGLGGGRAGEVADGDDVLEVKAREERR
jgi:hypothetical protein